MSEESKDCTNCKYGEWKMTKHNPPRINKNYAGRCLHTVLLDDLRAIVSAATLHSARDWAYNFDRPKYINFYKMPHDCRVWEGKV